MKALLAIFVIAFIGLVLGQKYTTKYDNIDLDQILNSERLLNNYFNCIMDRGQCTPDGLELKKNIPDALKTDCAKCSEKQTNGTKKVIKFLAKKKPDLFKELSDKFDPEGLYKEKHREEFEKEGIKI